MQFNDTSLSKPVVGSIPMDRSVDLQEMKDLQARVEYPLSENDIELYLGKNAPIIAFSELKNYNHIDDLLPFDRSYVIILIEQERNSGHWIALLRYTERDETIIEYFNSYGLKPNFEMKFLDRLFGQNKDDLTRLLKKNDYYVIYNTYKFQKLDFNQPSINTCGRHVINRIVAMKDLQLNLIEYISTMENLQKKYKLPYDLLIAMLV